VEYQHAAVPSQVWQWANDPPILRQSYQRHRLLCVIKGFWALRPPSLYLGLAAKEAGARDWHWSTGCHSFRGMRPPLTRTIGLVDTLQALVQISTLETWQNPVKMERELSQMKMGLQQLDSFCIVAQTLTDAWASQDLAQWSATFQWLIWVCFLALLSLTVWVTSFCRCASCMTHVSPTGMWALL